MTKAGCNPVWFKPKPIFRSQDESKHLRGLRCYFSQFSIAVIVTILLNQTIVVTSTELESSKSNLVASNRSVSMKGEGGSPFKSAESRDLLDSLNPSSLLEKLPKIRTEVIDKDELPHDKTFFGEDANGNPIVVGTWFQYGSYTLAVAMFGTAFLVACAATAVYYVLFVVTEPSQSRSRSLKGDAVSNSTISAWNANGILKSLIIAYETYENRDIFVRPECQKRLLCEMNESKLLSESNIIKSFADAMFNYDSLINWIPWPKLRGLQKAYRSGLDPDASCSNIYSNCTFSVGQIQSQLQKKTFK